MGFDISNNNCVRTTCMFTWVRDDPKLPGDSGVVGGLIPVVKSSLYLTKKTS